MTAPAIATPAAELVGQWFDSDVPSSRCSALTLWRESDGELVLMVATRWTPAATWPPSVTVRRGVTQAEADAAAAMLGLDPYLVRGDEPAPEHSVRVGAGS